MTTSSMSRWKPAGISVRGSRTATSADRSYPKWSILISVMGTSGNPVRQLQGAAVRKFCGRRRAWQVVTSSVLTSGRPGRQWKFAPGMPALYLAFLALQSFPEQIGGTRTVRYLESKATVQANNLRRYYPERQPSSGTSASRTQRQELIGVPYRQLAVGPAYTNDDLLSQLPQDRLTTQMTPIVRERAFLGTVLLSVALKHRVQRTQVRLDSDPLQDTLVMD